MSRSNHPPPPARSVLFDANKDEGPFSPSDEIDYVPTNYAGYGGNNRHHPSSYAPPPANSHSTYYSQSNSQTHFPVQGRMFAMSTAFGDGGYADEPPLTEELGINFSHMHSKSLTVLNPFKAVEKDIMDDSDLAGPLVFCLLYGSFLLLTGKIRFGYIYGLALLGCCSIYILLNVMSEQGIDVSRTASVLGYCLLPLVILASLSLLLPLRGSVGYSIAIASILWCTYSSSTIFVTILSMKDQRWLVAYPIGLFYACFAMMTIF